MWTALQPGIIRRCWRVVARNLLAPQLISAGARVAGEAAETTFARALPADFAAQAGALWRQHRELILGVERPSSDTPAEAFLRLLWTPHCHIVAVTERDDALLVLTECGYDEFVRSALPVRFRGLRTQIVETSWVATEPRRPRPPMRPVVLLTGASTGIGLALAKKLCSASTHRLVLTARESSLPRLAAAGLTESEHVWLRALDVTDAAQQQAVVDETIERWGGVDVLINNAGIAYRSTVEHMTDGEMRQVMETNFFGPRALTRRVLPLMRLKGRGHVIVNSSVAGFITAPTKGSYSASKFATEGETEGLWHEMHTYGVDVSILEPGFVHSDAAEKVVWSVGALKARDNPRDPYHRAYIEMERLISWATSKSHSTPESIADDVLQLLRAGRTTSLRVRSTSDGRFFRLLTQLPEVVQRWFIRRNMPNYARWRWLDPD